MNSLRGLNLGDEENCFLRSFCCPGAACPHIAWDRLIKPPRSRCISCNVTATITNGTIISSTWNQNFRVWKLFSAKLLSRWRCTVTMPLASLEVCLFLRFRYRFWWLLSHLSPGNWAEAREQVCQAWQLTSAGLEKEGPGGAFPLSGEYHCWGLPATPPPAPPVGGCHAASLNGMLVEHITEWNLLNWLLLKSQNIFY